MLSHALFLLRRSLAAGGRHKQFSIFPSPSFPVNACSYCVCMSIQSCSGICLLRVLSRVKAAITWVVVGSLQTKRPCEILQPAGSRFAEATATRPKHHPHGYTRASLASLVLAMTVLNTSVMLLNPRFRQSDKCAHPHSVLSTILSCLTSSGHQTSSWA